MFDELWSEIADSSGEIFDIEDDEDESEFDFDSYINSNYDY